MSVKDINPPVDAMLCAKKKWQKPEKSPGYTVECPEGDIQSFVNEYLSIVKKIDYIRVEDDFFNWIAAKIKSEQVRKWFFWMFGGRPDNTIIVPIGKGVAISLLLELKTQDKKGRAVGRLHGKQRHHEEDWVICRSVNDARATIDKFEKTVERIKNIVRSEKV